MVTGCAHPCVAPPTLAACSADAAKRYVQLTDPRTPAAERLNFPDSVRVVTPTASFQCRASAFGGSTSLSRMPVSAVRGVRVRARVPSAVWYRPAATHRPHARCQADCAVSCMSSSHACAHALYALQPVLLHMTKDVAQIARLEAQYADATATAQGAAERKQELMHRAEEHRAAMRRIGQQMDEVRGAQVCPHP
ncbi:hypothetical protein EON66_00420 [archaeon]|nr:MAG: hypothetical protein EON66_00420 [archaeon]